MAFSFIGTNSAEGSTGSSIALTKVASTAANDLILVLISREDQTAAPSSIPSGFSAIETISSIETNYSFSGIYYKIATGSEPASYTFSFAASDGYRGEIAVYRGGFDTANPIDQSSSVNWTYYNSTLHADGVTVTSDNSPAIFAGGVYDLGGRTFTPPSGWDEDIDTGGTNGDFWHTFASTLVGSGATGSVEATISSGTTPKNAFLVVLNPVVETLVDLTGASFSYAGGALTVTTQLHVDLTGASLSYAGASLVADVSFSADLTGASFSYAGASLVADVSFSADLTGASFSYAGASLVADVLADLAGASFSYAGGELDLNAPIVINGASFSYTGAALTVDKLESLSGASFSYAGASLVADVLADLDGASFSYAGASLVADASFSADLDGASFSYVGGALTITAQLRVDLTGASFSYAGGELGTSLATRLDVAGASFSYAGGELDSDISFTFELSGASFSYAGGELDANLPFDNILLGASYSYTGGSVVEQLTVQYTPRLNNYLRTAPLPDLIEDLIRMPVMAMGDSDQILDKLLNRRHLGDASGAWLDIDGDIVGVSRPLEEIPDDEYFEFGDTYVGAAPVYSNGFANLAQTTGGKLRGLNGTWLDGETYIGDADYDRLIDAKAYATFKGSTLKNLLDYIAYAFDVAASVYIDSNSDWHVVLDEYLETKYRRYLLQYAPVPAGSTITIDNWPEDV